jgi:hypothetical protein
VLSTANGGFVQGFNAQAVATREQIIIACAVTADPNDYAQLKPMVEQAKQNLAWVGVGQAVGVVVADAGYLTEDNLGLEGELGVELVIATKDSTHPEFTCQPRPRGRIPKTVSRTQRMTRKLRTRRGERLYRKRAGSIEPVFGQQKQRGAGRFRRRGLKACNAEWRFESLVHNLLKIRTSRRWQPSTPPPRNPTWKISFALGCPSHP